MSFASVTGELEERFAELGLSLKTGWYAGIVLYAVAGSVVVIVGLVEPESYSTGFLVVGWLALAMAVLSVLGLRFVPDAPWATHARVVIGLALQIAGAAMVGDARQSFVLFPLLSIVPTVIYFGWRVAVPYATVGIGFVFVACVTLDGPYAWQMAIGACMTLLAVELAAMVVQTRTRSLAVRNRELAYTDALTGIANVRKLREQLAAKLTSKPVQPLALYAIDLDNFKLVNDLFDHRTGDEVLQAVARELSAVAGADDLVARRGGDEFAVLVSNPGERDLAALRGDLTAAIARARKRVCPAVTPSGGVAFVCVELGDSVGSALRRADEALHIAKLSDRDSREQRPGTAARPVLAQRRIEPIAPSPAETTAKLRCARRLLAHVGFTGAIALLAAGVLLAGPAGVAPVSLLAATGLIAVLCFGRPFAGIYLVSSLALYIGLTLAGDFAYAETRIACATVAMLGTAGLLSKVRTVSSRYIAQNWELSQTDELTGLANTRATRARVNDALARVKRGGPRPAIVAIDLDGFKRVNDEFSHTLGDQMLVAVARAIAENVRLGDLVARRGGDEFIVLIEDADAEDVDLVVARLREAVAAARTRVCPDLAATSGIGAVRWTQNESASDFLRRSDVALHAEKSGTRGLAAVG